MIPKEYPRPNMYRQSWRSLNGPWEFDFYDDAFVLAHKEKLAETLGRTIQVPFSYQTRLSGIDDKDIHERLVYRKKIQLTDAERDHRVRLHFAAVDFFAEVWIDDVCVGSHTGGYTPFYFDIDRFFEDRHAITLSLIVEDKPSAEQPRGKQAVATPFACWYTAVSGIWQSVWLEFLPDVYIAELSGEQHAGSGTADFRVQISGPAKECQITAEVLFDGQCVASSEVECAYPSTEIHFDIPTIRRWSPENPNLYEVKFSLMQANVLIDQVETYLSFRTIDMRSDGLYLNGERYFQKLVLMQGYWMESGYSPPGRDSFDRDILMAKEMGFNGCRMHMKFEDPRFLHAADRLGFLVWGEAPSFYSFSASACAVFRKELTEIVNRDMRHPSLIAWVIGNESWGIKEISESERIRSWLDEIVQMTRSIDPSRPVISNDGWEHLDSDIMTLHSYEHSAESLREDWHKARKNERCGIHNRVFHLRPTDTLTLPWVLSEFGAISFIGESREVDHWGYGDTAESTEAFLSLLRHILEAASSLDGISGWCYTQFSDVEKEKNGLLFADRTPKVEPSHIRDLIKEIVNN